MPKQLLASENIWLFGTKWVWNIYRSTKVLDPFQYRVTGGVPDRKQKNQIVMHWTAGNGNGDSAIDTWNDNAAQQKYSGAHFVVEMARHRTNNTDPYVDVVRVIEEDLVTWQGDVTNDFAIGIEHSNVGWDWKGASGDTYNGTGANKRPRNRNHFLHIDNPNYPESDVAHNDYQYFEDEQYLGMILLLRHLCIKHRIPRRFLGDTPGEKFRRYWFDLTSDQAYWRSRLMHFRGILSHMNVSKARKECGGVAMQRNRLFRGLIDEWWMPVQLDGTDRPYYMGPFETKNDVACYSRWNNGTLSTELFHDTNMDALQETKSYFDFDQLPLYYAWTEDAARGGSFPIGTNRIWHGGVHFEPPASNLKIYAAASGAIVAARLGSDNTLENDASYGSQRFVLVRHAVYMDQEADPGGGMRTNYTADPHYVFTLYMHLAPFANLTAEDDNNPPWFNYWLRHRKAAADANAVFYPKVPILPGGAETGTPVMVGDWVGSCGFFRKPHTIVHFEVLSKEEFTVAPWNDPNFRAEDKDTNLLCDVPNINQFVKSRTGKQIDEVDIIRAAPGLRKVKSYHKSEWALTGPDALVGLIAKPELRDAKWKSLKPFMWVADAVAANPDISTQLCDATGMMWHYHPVTFMEYVNRMVAKENAQTQEPDNTATNVEIDGQFLTRFLNWNAASKTFGDGTADSAGLVPYGVSMGAFKYHFTRADIACKLPGNHSPGPTPPTATKFHLSLLDLLQTAREIFGGSVDVVMSYLCDAHNTGLNTGLCAVVTTAAHAIHNAGLAVDIRPSSKTPANCASLWRAVQQAIGSYNADCSAHAGEPSRPELGGLASATAHYTIQPKLVSGTALTNDEAKNFLLHIQLQEPISSVTWECFVQRPTKAVDVRIQNGGIIVTYNTMDEAVAEVIGGKRSVATRKDGKFDGWLRLPTEAIGVRLQNYVGDQCVIGIYNSAEPAEKEKMVDYAWPVQH